MIHCVPRICSPKAVLKLRKMGCCSWRLRINRVF